MLYLVIEFVFIFALEIALNSEFKFVFRRFAVALFQELTAILHLVKLDLTLFLLQFLLHAKILFAIFTLNLEVI